MALPPIKREPASIGYHAIFAIAKAAQAVFFLFHDAFFKPFRMILHALLWVATWDQLERIWEFVIGFFKFLWALLRFLGGG
ncbi:conserved hypothetical protein [Burkholderia sp. 8Y]|uniref:hypothetical protein n=1 Tax=Burkholderia sp. 8Y TaxID=2653133 RepID=UPI0012F304BD|nr:hypothetical protein [Burkholderia sp. 8Y]VXB92435.1 conserved hypothetical protein [Burkholderia sp. 8Y]